MLHGEYCYILKNTTLYAYKKVDSIYSLQQTVNNITYTNMNQSHLEYVSNDTIYLCTFVVEQIIAKLTRYNYDYFNTQDSNIVNTDILNGKIAYGSNGKITGTMPNNGTLNYTPTDNVQTIPAGYTSGGTIDAIDITTLNDYTTCLELSEQIMATEPIPQYVELEYIEGTGTQYINSGFKPNQNTRIEMKVGDPTSGAYFFGAWNTAYNRGAYAFGNDNSSLYAGYGNQGGGFGTIISGDTTIDMNKKDIYINGALSKSFNVDTFQVNYDLYLFCQNRAGTPTWNSVSAPHSFKLYYCKIYDNDILTRDFIPVKDLNDVVCLYDKVSDTFFYNQGTGDFIGGGEI